MKKLSITIVIILIITAFVGCNKTEQIEQQVFQDVKREESGEWVNVRFEKLYENEFIVGTEISQIASF